MTPAAVEATLNAFEAIEDSGVHDDWKEALEGCLNQLPSRSRRILSMRYNRETDIDTMASKLGKTAAAIYQSLSRIRKQLELCMRKRLGTIS